VIDGDLSRLVQIGTDFFGWDAHRQWFNFEEWNIWDILRDAGTYELLLCVVDLTNGRISDGLFHRLSVLIDSAMEVFPIRVLPSLERNFDVFGPHELGEWSPWFADGGVGTFLEVSGESSPGAVLMEPFLFHGIVLTTDAVRLAECAVLVRFELTNHNSEETLSTRLRFEAARIADGYQLDSFREGFIFLGETHCLTCIREQCPFARDFVSWWYRNAVPAYLRCSTDEIEIPAGESATIGLVFQSGLKWDRPSLTLSNGLGGPWVIEDPFHVSGSVNDTKNYTLYVVPDSDISRLFPVGIGLDTLFDFDLPLSDLIDGGTHQLVFCVVDLVNGRISDEVNIVVNAVRFGPTITPVLTPTNSPSGTMSTTPTQTRSSSPTETETMTPTRTRSSSPSETATATPPKNKTGPPRGTPERSPAFPVATTESTSTTILSPRLASEGSAANVASVTAKIGGTLGGLVLAGILVAIILILVLRKRSRNEDFDSEDSDEQVDGMVETTSPMSLKDHYVSQEAPSDEGHQNLVVEQADIVADEC
jgi:hypothetical protein